VWLDGPNTAAQSALCSSGQGQERTCPLSEYLRCWTTSFLAQIAPYSGVTSANWLLKAVSLVSQASAASVCTFCGLLNGSDTCITKLGTLFNMRRDQDFRDSCRPRCPVHYVRCFRLRRETAIGTTLSNTPF